MQGVTTNLARTISATVISTFWSNKRIHLASAVIWFYPIILLLNEWVLTISTQYGLLLHSVLVVALIVHHVVLIDQKHHNLLLLSLSFVPMTRLVSAILVNRDTPADLLPFVAGAPMFFFLCIIGLIHLRHARDDRAQARVYRLAQANFTFPQFTAPQGSIGNGNINTVDRFFGQSNLQNNLMTPSTRGGRRRDLWKFLGDATIQLQIALSGIAIGALISIVFHALDIRSLSIVTHASAMVYLDANVPPTPIFLAGLGLLAVVEELVFRGLVLSGARIMLGSGGVLFSAAVWTATSMSFYSPHYLLITFTLALLMGMAAEWSGSLVGVSIAHALANVVIVIWPVLLQLSARALSIPLSGVVVASALMGVIAILRLVWNPHALSNEATGA